MSILPVIAAWLFTAGVCIWAVCTLVSVAREARRDDERFRWRMELIRLLYKKEEVERPNP